MKLRALKTPAALVDLDVVERNTTHMAERMARLGCRLRPHVKTHKCVEIARLQVRGHFGGITVSTLAEARLFAAAGFRDITYAFPLPINRIEEAASLGSQLDRFSVLLDHPATLHELETHSHRTGVRFSVFLKVDCGYHRVGVDPDRDESVWFAAKLSQSPHLDFRGILTHAGQSYRCRTLEEISRVAGQEREVMVAFANRLRQAGVRVDEVSVGSTPTMSVTQDLEGVTEARPGNYVFYDAFQASIGSCSLSDCAFSVLVTVVGQYPDRNKLVVDGGSLAFSLDPGPRHADPECGYGSFITTDGRRPMPELRLVSMSQEHGQIYGRGPIDFERYPVGSQLRIVPNHSCLAAAMFDRYHVVREDHVLDEWSPIRGW
jgi:D-serine deaminase-like pyridoxal phosphate-dependent protein